MKALLLLGVLGSQAFAGRPFLPAPEFPEGAAWVNSRPFTLARLRKRRVTLIAFFHTADLHSLRALEALKAWNRRYEFHGLSIIGVHSPEYGFQRDPVAVRRDLQRFGVDFPVVLDANGQLWRQYGNEGWPAFYVLDLRGGIIQEKLGEMGYPQFEKDIRLALTEAGFEPPEGRPLADPRAVDCGDSSAPVSVGARKGKVIDLEKKQEAGGRQVLSASRAGEVASSGAWDVEADSLRLAQGNADQSAFVRVIYQGAQAFAILAPPPGGGRFWIRQDELWLHPGIAGSDVSFDEDGRSFVKADRARLYHLTDNPGDQPRQMVVFPEKKGSTVYGFAFTDRCLSVKLPPP